MVPVILTIAGSDSGGGAGIQGDLKTFEAHGCFGTSVITALTAQNTIGVSDVLAIPVEFVKKQLDAIFEDFDVKAIKIGMIYSAETVQLLAGYDFKGIPVVYDPVMVSTSGHSLISEKIDFDPLLRKVTLLTPNSLEAQALSGLPEVTDLSHVRQAGDILSSKSKAVLIKGGHLTGEEVVDTLVSPNGHFAFVHGRNSTRNTHGTGCTLSSAIAANLGLGYDLETSVKNGLHYVWGAIEHASGVGTGSNGPLNHAWNTTKRAVPVRTSFAPHPFTDIIFAAAGQVWDNYINHPVCREIALGTLPIEGFTRYLCEDYQYLNSYLRLHGLGIAKATDDTVKETAFMARVLGNITREMEHHLTKCEQFGLSRETVMNYKESTVTTAYTRYMLDVANSGTALDIHIAAYSCLIGYGYMGVRMVELAKEHGTLENNPYRLWLEQYAGSDFWKSVKAGRDLIEERIEAEQVSPSQLKRFIDIFIRTTEFENLFFDHGKV